MDLNGYKLGVGVMVHEATLGILAYEGEGISDQVMVGSLGCIVVCFVAGT